MSKAEALRFLQQAEVDVEFVEKLRAARMEGRDDTSATFSSVAAGFGFDFSDEELQAASDELYRSELAEAQTAEVSDEELEQVAGGAGNHYACSSTFDDGENCFHDDQCDRVYNYYKIRPDCEYTYIPRETCISLDRNFGGV